MKNFFYILLDLLTLRRGIKRHISGFTVRIPTRFYKYFEADYELSNVSFINQYVKEGFSIIDIGAHIGLMTVILSKKAGAKGKVYSFEPTPSTFKVLEETVKINNLSSIATPVNAAVSGTTGKAVFYITDINAHNSNSLADNKRNYGNERGVEVDLVNLDNFATQRGIQKIDFIKIDAEGAEYSVLKGSSEIIDKYKPIMLLALHPYSIKNFGDNLSDIWDFIKQKNYKVYFNSREIDKNYFISQDDLFDVHLLP